MAKHKKLLFVLLMTAVVVFAGVFFLRPIATKPVAINGVVLPQATPIKPFALTDNQGKPFTEANLNGHWTLLFFGFTNCGMVCPTTLSELSDMYKRLEKELPADQLPQVVLISVDPERDNVARMNEYVHAFNPHFIGARAEIAETVALENQMHIAAAKIEADGKGKNHYTINHSAEILLVNPKGQLLAYFSYPHKGPEMASDYKAILAVNPS